jgi:hypothetical protein
MVERKIVSGVSPPFYAGAPYGDQMEVTGPPTFEIIPEPYREFLATDARTVLIVIHPNHYNFFPNPAFRVSTDGWELPFGDTVLDEAIWSVDVSKMDETKTRLLDMSGDGRDMVPGTKSPLYMPHTGEDYLVIPAAGQVNYLGGITPTIVPVGDLYWDIGTTTLGDGLWLIYSTQANGAVTVKIRSDGGFEMVTWVAGVQRMIVWGGAVIPNTRATYRLNYDTTGATLYIDGQYRGRQNFGGATRVTAANNSDKLLYPAGTVGGLYSIYSFNLGQQYVFRPSNSTDGTSVPNSGGLGGTWTIVRGTNSTLKSALVDRPVLLFSGAGDQSMKAIMPDTGPSTSNMTAIALVRAWPGTIANALYFLAGGKLANAHPDKHGFTLFKSTAGLGVASVYSGNLADYPTGVAFTGYQAAGAVADAASVKNLHSGTVDTTVGRVGADPAWLPGETLGIGQYESSLMSGCFEFLAAAVWDRALTDAEAQEAISLMRSGYVQGIGGLNPDDSWVGQSLQVTGTGTVRYRAEDIDGNPAFVYVGPTQDLDQQDWYEPGRSAAGWTFSAFTKGAGRVSTGITDPPAMVRLIMQAYHAEDPTAAFSPPANQNLPDMPVGEGANAPDPKVIGPNGNVWVRKDESFYEPLGFIPVSEVDPLLILSTGPLHPEGIEPYLMYNNKVYVLKTPMVEVAGYTYYWSGFSPTVVTEDPRDMTPGPSYVLVSIPGDHRDGQVWKKLPGPYYEDTTEKPYFAEAAGEWTELVDQGWERHMIRTAAWTPEDEGRINFSGCFWIDARLEFMNCKDVLISAFMLDPNENTVAEYFDGSMTEDPALDDFIWSKTFTEDGDYVTPKANECVSYYYYDRRARVRWLQENLRYVVPVDRPYQIFFGALDRPHIPETLSTGPGARVGRLTL